MKKDVSVQVFNVDKDLASRLLSKNDINRPLRSNRVKKYGIQMQRGQWVLNGETIIVGEDGSLLDGQHRLEAIRKYNLRIPMLICKNVKQDAFNTIDTGDSRTAKDVLVIEKGLNASIAGSLSSCIRFDIVFKYSGRLAYDGKYASYVMPNNILKASEEDPSYQNAVEFVHSFGRSGRILAAGMLSFLTYRFEKINGSKSEEWMSGLLSGANLGSKDMRLYIRDFFFAEKTSNAKRSTAMKAAMIVKAWKHAMEGTSVVRHTLITHRTNPLPYIRLETDIYKA